MIFPRSRALNRTLGTIRASFLLAMRQFLADPQWIIPMLVAPFFFTLVSVVLYNVNSGEQLLYVEVGGSAMGMWATVVYGPGQSLGFDRWNGTLTPTLLAPTNLVWVVSGRVFWYALVGLLSSLSVFAAGLLWLGASLTFVSVPLLALGAVVGFVSLSAFGILLSSAYLLTRNAVYIQNGLELPLYILTGTMFPVTLLSQFPRLVGFALGPTWAIDAVRLAALPTYRTIGFGYLTDLAISMGETTAYFVLALFVFQRIERRTRSEGTLEKV